MARKSKYTPEVVEKLTQAIRLGAIHEHACAYAGINPDTFYSWMKQYSEFSEAIKSAEAVGLIGWLAKIEKAATDGDWHAAAWKAERRYPQIYGKQALEITGKDGGAIPVVAFKWTDGDDNGGHETD